MKKFVELLKSEEANATVEAVIVFPIVFVAIFSILSFSFILHDKATYDAAAKRGAIYAAHCIANPNYKAILNASKNTSGSLDIDESVDSSNFSFTGTSKNIQPYRAFQKKTPGLEDDVETEVLAIIKNTKVNWFKLDEKNVTVEQDNRFYYQDVTVSIKAEYPMPKVFEMIGIENKFDYTATAKMTVNDPDEFIRDVDMVVDFIIMLDDNIFGGKINNTLSKISSVITKALDWLDTSK